MLPLHGHLRISKSKQQYSSRPLLIAISFCIFRSPPNERLGERSRSTLERTWEEVRQGAQAYTCSDLPPGTIGLLRASLARGVLLTSAGRGAVQRHSSRLFARPQHLRGGHPARRRRLNRRLRHLPEIFALRRDPLKIIENAALAVQDLNKRALTIKVDTARRHNDIRITVIDTRTSIDKRARMFNPSLHLARRCDGTRPDAGQPSIKHEGDIKLNSLSVQGTVTRITFPTALPGLGDLKESARPRYSRIHWEY